MLPRSEKNLAARLSTDARNDTSVYVRSHACNSCGAKFLPRAACSAESCKVRALGLRLLFCQHFFQTVGIESNHYLIANNDCRGSAALICPDQLEHGLLVHAHVLYLKRNPFLRKVGLCP